MIAIKNADGTLVPVIQSNSGADQTVALSLVHSHQRRAEIFLYEIPDTEQASHVNELETPEPFGKLVLRRLPDNPFGEVEIQARLTVDPQFVVHVVAGAMGEKSVSASFRIPSKSDASTHDIPFYEEEEADDPAEIEAVASVVPETNDAFIDDPDDTDWGFDVLADPNDENLDLGPDDQIPLGNENVEVGEDELPDFDASIPSFDDEELQLEDETLDLGNELSAMPEEFAEDDDFEPPPTVVAATPAPTAANQKNTSYQKQELDRAPKEYDAGSSSNEPWSPKDLFFLRASIILFAISLVEMGVFLVLRMPRVWG